jgi:large subunit ribosomal protein L25
MTSEKITAEVRTEFGKGFARRIRRDGKIPAVIYANNIDPIHIVLPGHETLMTLRHHGKNALLEIEIDGKTQLALTKQVQVDDLRRVIEHIDFVAVKRGEKVTVEIQVAIVGEPAKDTILTVENQTLTVEAEATHVPESIEVSIEGLEAGSTVHAGDVPLPEGIILLTAEDTNVLHLAAAPTAAQAEASLEAAEAEAGIVHETAGDESAAADAE